MSLSEQFAGARGEAASEALQAAMSAAATTAHPQPQKPLAPAAPHAGARVCEGWASVPPAGPADGWHIPFVPNEHPPLERIAAALERITAAMEAGARLQMPEDAQARARRECEARGGTWMAATPTWAAAMPAYGGLGGMSGPAPSSPTTGVSGENG
jgi:hypothetical protein